MTLSILLSDPWFWMCLTVGMLLLCIFIAAH